MSGTAIRIGDLLLIPHRELRRGDASLPIGGRALTILSELAAAEGLLVSKDQLFARVWPDAIVEENALQAQISATRKALGGEARRLVTVHGRGYRLELDPRAEAPHAATDPASIAVVPFDNLSGDPESDYLANGLTEDTIVSLGRIDPEGVSVIGRTSMIAYRGTKKSLAEIGRELGTDYLVESSLRVESSHLRNTPN